MRHVTEPDVAGDPRGVARHRIAEAAAARRLQPDVLTGLDLDVGDLGDQRRRALARIGLDRRSGSAPRAAAVDAERRKFAALAKQEHVGAAFASASIS